MNVMPYVDIAFIYVYVLNWRITVALDDRTVAKFLRLRLHLADVAK